MDTKEREELEGEIKKIEKDNEHLRLIVSSATTDTDDEEIAGMLMDCIDNFLMQENIPITYEQGAREAVCDAMSHMIAMKSSRMKARIKELEEEILKLRKS